MPLPLARPVDAAETLRLMNSEQRTANRGTAGAAMTDQLPDLDQLWDYDNPQATEQSLRAVLPVARAAGQDAYLAELLTQIARAQGLKRTFDAAHRTLDEAETLLRPEHVRARLRYLLERGRVLNSAGQPARARAFFLEAWQLATEHAADFYAIDAAHMLGIIEPPTDQLAWHQRPGPGGAQRGGAGAPVARLVVQQHRLDLPCPRTL